MIKARHRQGAVHLLKLLFLIFVAQLAYAYLVLHAAQTSHPKTLLLAYYAAVFIGAPLQGHVSDNYHRKSVLVSAFVCIACTVVYLGFFGLASYSLSIVAAAVLGLWGNGDVLARAALFDQAPAPAGGTGRSRRLLMGWSFAALAPPWLLLWPLAILFSGAKVGASVVVVSAAIAAVVSFTIHDDADMDEKVRPKSMISILASHGLWIYLLALLALQVAFQSVFLETQEAGKEPGIVGAVHTMLAAAAFILCSLGQAYVVRSDARVVRAGILLSVLGLVIAAIVTVLPYNLQYVRVVSLFILFMGVTGIYLPRYFMLQTDFFGTHEHGMVFGLLEAVLVLGEVMTSAFVLRIMPSLIPIVAVLLLILGYIVFGVATRSSRPA